MVKNTAGGSKHKSMARKNANSGGSTKIHMPEEDGECFAKVTKMLGNGMCEVTLQNGDEFIENVVCFIRGKFRSKNKRHNLVSNDSFLIVGLRTWSSNSKQCDLIHVFDNSILNSLLNHIPFKTFHNHFHSNLHSNDFIFSNTTHTTPQLLQHQHHDLDHHQHHDHDHDHDLDHDLDLDAI